MTRHVRLRSGAPAAPALATETARAADVPGDAAPDRLSRFACHVTALLGAPNHALPVWRVVLPRVRHHRAAQFARGAALPLAAAAAGAAMLAGGRTPTPHRHWRGVE